MHRHRCAVLGAILVATSVSTVACGRSEVPTGAAPEPQGAGFAALEANGERNHGAGLHASSHLFEALSDGGRIALQHGGADAAGVDGIRRHLGALAQILASADFDGGPLVRLRESPRIAALAGFGDRIEYVYSDLPHGAELRLVTHDAEAIGAIHELVALHREGHQTGVGHHGRHEHREAEHERHGPDHERAGAHHGAHGMLPAGAAGRPTHGVHTPAGDTP